MALPVRMSAPMPPIIRRANDMTDENRIYNLEDYGAEQRTDDDIVPCAKCGELIAAQAIRCPHCGIHFSGSACDFVPEEQTYRMRSASRLRRVAWTILTVIVITAILTLLTGL